MANIRPSWTHLFQSLRWKQCCIFGLAIALVLGYKPLNRAINIQDIPHVTTLLEQGANPNISAQGWGLTALRNAIADNEPDIVRLLLAHEANVNANGWRGMSMLQWAIANAEDTTIIQLLLEAGADVGRPDNQGNTAWDYAQHANNPDIQDLLQPYMKESNATTP